MSDKLELLAPAGTWDVLENVAGAGADAVYIGGKRFNMRLLKGDFNFTDEEIKRAVTFLHDQNKKLYITINNLYFENETEEIKEYLLFLEDIGVDALIVQDLSIVNLKKELNLTLPLHASVQMGIGNSEAVKFLEKQGFSRVILSKNLSLDEIKEISNNTNLSIEFFAHGDLCISHTGQCYMSSFVASASGNRGKCIKPCRWQYAVNPGGERSYYLAHNDLSLYPFIADLFKAGVSSLKIEGRMRTADYLSKIVSLYREAINKIIEDKDNYKVDPNGLAQLESIKIRNLTAAGLWGELEKDTVDISGEREPYFPTKPRQLKKLQLEDSREDKSDEPYKCEELAVKIGSIESFEVVKDYCDTVIVGLEKFKEINSGFNLEEIRDLLDIAKDYSVNIKIETPRIVTQKNWEKIETLSALKDHKEKIGFIVNDLGSFNYLANLGFKVWGGPSLNITNSKANDLLINYNMLGLCLSQEIKLDNIAKLANGNKNYEIIVHGPLVGIITDYRIIDYHIDIKDNQPCLYDEYNQAYPLLRDNEGRTYIYFPYDLCLYNYLSVFLEMGITRMRIDGQFYDLDTIDKLVKIYNQKLNLKEKDSLTSFTNLINIFDKGLTDLAFTRPTV
ncbi:MAG: hypothetical protein GX790_04125 [Syntrophomonadaceae bacterium]|nr:hypothetical protein [Syntrophomonadaceae bacterium]